VVDHDHAARELVGFFEVVGGEDDRASFRGEGADLLEKTAASLDIHPDGRLVEE